MYSKFYYKLSLIIILVICLFFVYKTFNIYQSLKTKSIKNKIYYTTQDFPQLKILEDNWEVISKEIPPFDINEKYPRRKPIWLNDKLKRQIEYIKEIKSQWYEGWQGDYVWYNFPLMLHDKPIDKAKKKCPNTIKILQKLNCKRIVGFSILIPFSKLYKHNDPVGKKYGSMACNLLLTPNKTAKLLVDSSNSSNKYKYTHSYTHSQGKMVIFDSTNLHTATNNDSDIRTILYMDFESK